MRNKVHFHHIRFFDEPNVDSYSDFADEEPEYNYTPDIDNFGGATFAWRELKKTKKDQKEIYILYSLAKCCDTDQFVRKIGRTIASQRLKLSRTTVRLKFPVDKTTEALNNEEVVKTLRDIYIKDQSMFRPGLEDYLVTK